MDVQFFQTRMGARFYEATLPDLVRHLGRIADSLERLISAIERKTEHAAAGGPLPEEGETK